jgi:hypothetical protein
LIAIAAADLMRKIAERDVYTSAEYGPAVYQTTFTAVVILRAIKTTISTIVGSGSRHFTEWGCIWTTVTISGDLKNGFQTTEKWNSTCGLKLKLLEGSPIAERHKHEIQKQLDDARAEFLNHDRNMTNIDEVIQQITSYRNALREAAQGRPLS